MSRIRANKITNKIGTGAVELEKGAHLPIGMGITGAGGLNITGVITATSFSGSGANLTGIDATSIKDSGGNVKVQAQASGAVYTGIHTFNSDIDVDGHTNLDNISVAGVSTFSNIVNVGNKIQLNSSSGAITVGSGVTIESNGQATFTGIVTFGSGSTTIDNNVVNVGTALTLGHTQGVQFHTQNLHSQGFEVNQINASGIVTASSFRGDGSQLTGIAATTNVRTNSLQVSGVSTFSDDVTFTGTTGNIVFDKSDNSLNIKDGTSLKIGDGTDLHIYHGGAGLANATFIDENGSGRLRIRTNDHVEIGKIASASKTARFFADAQAELFFNDVKKFETTQAGAIVTGILTATSFSGDGSSLSNLPAGAPVGGASTNTVFFENDKEVAVNYQITSTKNAMTAGPVAINAGIAVTVPSGCAWTIV